MKLIAFTGVSGSGKDYQAELLRQRGFRHLKFAMGLRALVYSELGIPKILTKPQEIDNGIQDLLVSRSREVLKIDPLLWVHILEHFMWLKTDDTKNLWVISDLRQRDEYDWVLDGWGSVYRITRASKAKEQPLDRLLEDLEIPVWDPENPLPTGHARITRYTDYDYLSDLCDRIAVFHPNPYAVLAWAHDYYDFLNPTGE